MTRKSLVLSLVMLAILITIPPVTMGAEKLKLGTGFRQWPPYYLTVLAAEERGFWRQNNLDIDWVPFSEVASLMQAVAAREIYVGLSVAVTLFQAMAAGLPVVVLADFHSRELFNLWVRNESPIKKPADLKGAKIGVARLGAPPYIYARFLSKALGIEKDVRIVALGTVPSVLAGLQVGRVDAIIQPPDTVIELKVKGVFRQVASIADFLPKDWSLVIVFAHKSYIKDKPDVVRRVVRALVQASNFIMENPSWTIEKIKSVSGFSEESAKELYLMYQFSRDGKINRKGLDNVVNFLIEYGMVSREKVPPLDEMYTTKFTE